MACFGDPEQPFPCLREAVVAIAAIGVQDNGEPLPLFAASCRVHRAALKRFVDHQSVDPSHPDYGTHFYPLEPFLDAIERSGYGHPDFIDWHAAERRSA